MAIIIRLDRVLADRKMQLSELSEKVDISIVNLSNLKTGKVRPVGIFILHRTFVVHLYRAIGNT